MNQPARFALVLCLFLALAACTSNTTTPAVPSATPLPAVSEMPSPTSYLFLPTASRTPEPVSTVTQTTTPKPVVEQYILTIEPTLPPHVELSGSLVLREEKPYLLDLSTLSQQPLPAEANVIVPDRACLTISPDRQRLVYWDYQEGKDLILMTADAKLQDVQKWNLDIEAEVIGWLDNQRIALMQWGNLGRVEIFDTTSGEWQTIDPVFPLASAHGEVFPPIGFYDPALTRVAVSRFLDSTNVYYHELWDVQSKKLLWEEPSNMGGSEDMFWSVSGEYFAVVSREEDDIRKSYSKLYLVTRDGQQIFLADRVIRNKPTWSPDGKQLVFYLQDLPLKADLPEYPYTQIVAVASVADHKMVVYAVHGIEGVNSPYLIWSPDGRYVALTDSSDPMDGTYSKFTARLLILDLLEKRVYVIKEVKETTEKIEVLGWLAAP